MKTRVFLICFIAALTSCIYGQNNQEIIISIIDKVRNINVNKDNSFDYLVGGREIFGERIKEIEKEKEHQQITICCSNGVLCCGKGKIFELDSDKINKICNLEEQGSESRVENIDNSRSIKIIYTGKITDINNKNENVKLLNDLKKSLNEKKCAFELALLDKINSIFKKINKKEFIEKINLEKI